MLEASSDILNLKKTIKDASAKVNSDKEDEDMNGFGPKMAPRSVREAELLSPQA